MCTTIVLWVYYYQQVGGCTHENQNLYGNLDFFEFSTQKYRILRTKFLSKMLRFLELWFLWDFFCKGDTRSHPELVLHVLWPSHPRLVLHELCPSLLSCEPIYSRCRPPTILPAKSRKRWS